MLKFSIIIPSYNSAQFIERAIESVLSQDYANVECIVIDGASTDGTLDILNKYEGRIIWISGEDKGQSDAINKGFKIASGDILADLDADDMYEKGAFSRVASFFEKNRDVKWIYGKCRIIDEQDREIWTPVTWVKTFWQRRFSYNRLLIMDFVAQPAVFWRRELIDEMGLFDVEDHLVMDYEYLLRIGKKYRPGFIDDYLANWRIHANSKSSRNYARRAKQGLNLVRRYTNSKALFFLHYLVYLGIVLIYSFSNYISRIKHGHLRES